MINAGYREPTHKNQYGSQLAFLTVPRALSRIHRITKFIVEDAIMETLLPNVNTSEGCFEIGVT
ncbi:cell division inhibition protein DicB, partial [Escherichia coli]|uniref:cell division inhibition protein DicB n=1 Tax=Escherichia coli TaxID=562 RepID=UPI003EE24F48